MDSDLIKALEHYKYSLIKYSEENTKNNSKVLQYLNKLHHMPVTVRHLQVTGIGKTVYGLRKADEDVRNAALELVAKWKAMVAADTMAEEVKHEEQEQEEDSLQIDESGVNVSANDSDDDSRHSDSSEVIRKSHRNKRSRKESTSESSEDDYKRKRQKSSEDEIGDNERASSSKKQHRKTSKEKEKKSSHSSGHNKSSSEKKRESSRKHKSEERSSKTKSKKHEEPSTSKSSGHKEKETHKSKHRSDSSHKTADKSKSKSDSKHKHKSDSSRVKKIKIDSDGINSGSGASFAEALGMLEPSGSKSMPKRKPEKNVSGEMKAETVDVNLSGLLPAISPNYRPLNYVEAGSNQRKVVSDDEALVRVMSSKNQKTKVYSGNKSSRSEVPTLFELCTNILQANIDALEYTGGVPYTILKPVLERATPEQLFSLEHHNPYLIEDTDDLWRKHCGREFRNRQRDELETWRDTYVRCLDEREAKLRALTANIKQSQDKSLPVRQTKLAYVDSFVKPPRDVARRQAKNGVVVDKERPKVTPSTRLAWLATEGAQAVVPNPVRGTERSSSALKPKKAPLMQKALALIKNRFRR